MKREEIEQLYIWDLDSIYENESSFYNDLQLAKQLLEQVLDLGNKIVNDSNHFYSFLLKQDDFERILNKLYAYCHMQCDCNPTNQDYQTMFASTISFIEDASTKLSFLTNVLCDHDELINSYLLEDRMKEYRYKIQSTLRFKEHILSKEQEELLSNVESISSSSSQVFDALRLEFPKIIVNGKRETLNSATLQQFLKNKDQKVRKNAYHKFFGEYKKFENVYATTLGGVMKKDVFFATQRKFSTALEASVFDDEVPTELFYKVLNHANNTYRPLFHRYNALKKELLQLDTIYNYDLSVPLVDKVNQTFTIEQSFEYIKEALKPLGENYLKIIDKAKEERWIDFFPTPGKRGGAYSSGSYDTKPFILMNYIHDYNSLSTLIHELGHSAHSYLSNSHQSFSNSGYRIFVAEVASTVNETLLIHTMIEKAKTKEEKCYYLYEQLENCVGLLFRQPMFAAFEDELHLKALRKEALSSKVITDLYQQMSVDYFGKDITVAPITAYSCYYVPHFYYNYYVYKYTIGMTLALAIVKRIQSGDQEQRDNYLKFLQSGGSMSPIDLLQLANVNPLNDDLYKDAFGYFEDVLNNFQELMKS
ncbi:oligoendopeptidase F [Tannockella kyphosi]|uniref:oligoendopeptidase F n=1 Tax=Tannockella kyphosi TaxID=2899121 RepID=UPI002013A380|nr:oligoendopeptidase F [Tannockella kyphosi]